MYFGRSSSNQSNQNSFKNLNSKSSPSSSSPSNDYYQIVLENNTYNIHKRYVDLRPVGDGSYGSVVKAYDSQTNMLVAIKKVKDANSNIGDSKRMLRELKLLRHFNLHENIITIYDIMTDPPNTADFKDIYIVTNLYESDLGKIILSKQDLKTEHHQYFLYQILRGLKYIHSANVLHRDLKPSNLLVNSTCDLAICDFGLSRGIESEYSEPMTEYVVTRCYRAPELLCENKCYGKAVDVWSVGCIFAELLTRNIFFKGDNPQHQLYEILNKLGMPSREKLDFIQSKVALACVLKFNSKKTQLPNFSDFFPKHTSYLALDLVRRMLEFNPFDRITVEQALEHPYLKSLSGQLPEPVCNNIFNFDREIMNLYNKKISNEDNGLGNSNNSNGNNNTNNNNPKISTMGKIYQNFKSNFNVFSAKNNNLKNKNSNGNNNNNNNNNKNKDSKDNKDNMNVLSEANLSTLKQKSGNFNTAESSDGGESEAIMLSQEDIQELIYSEVVLYNDSNPSKMSVVSPRDANESNKSIYSSLPPTPSASTTTRITPNSHSHSHGNDFDFDDEESLRSGKSQRTDKTGNHSTHDLLYSQFHPQPKSSNTRSHANTPSHSASQSNAPSQHQNENKLKEVQGLSPEYVQIQLMQMQMQMMQLQLQAQQPLQPNQFQQYQQQFQQLQIQFQQLQQQLSFLNEQSKNVFSLGSGTNGMISITGRSISPNLAESTFTDLTSSLIHSQHNFNSNSNNNYQQQSMNNNNNVDEFDKFKNLNQSLNILGSYDEDLSIDVDLNLFENEMNQLEQFGHRSSPHVVKDFLTRQNLSVMKSAEDFFSPDEELKMLATCSPSNFENCNNQNTFSSSQSQTSSRKNNNNNKSSSRKARSSASVHKTASQDSNNSVDLLFNSQSFSDNQFNNNNLPQLFTNHYVSSNSSSLKVSQLSPNNQMMMSEMNEMQFSPIIPFNTTSYNNNNNNNNMINMNGMNNLSNSIVSNNSNNSNNNSLPPSYYTNFGNMTLSAKSNNSNNSNNNNNLMNNMVMPMEELSHPYENKIITNNGGSVGSSGEKNKRKTTSNASYLTRENSLLKHIHK